MMIVVPVACATAEEAERQIENAKEADAVELRLDAFGKISAGEIKALVKMKKCIVTNRRKEEGGGMKEQEEEERISLLLGAIEAGPFAVDVELATASGLRQKVEKKAKEKGVKVILSFHDFEGTPGGLEEMVEEMLKEADFAKI
ncbi:type I 3-dehydroquinate dehydratase, partial [Candidatus Micrarchaeota archaeon]|nr:type I 3-dehydroquinate dehydratase [Candidatus Micrarchaeota archaeon]